MRFCSLGSGSEGNALLVQCALNRYVLLDCGFRLKELDARLAARGLSTDNIAAVLVTHEHGDHIGSALPLAARTNIPLYMSHGTALAVNA